MSALGLDYLTSNVGTAFPFAEDTSGLVYSPQEATYGNDAKFPVNALVDAYLSVPSHVLDAYLYRITPAGDQYEFHFIHADNIHLMTASLEALPVMTNGRGMVTFEAEDCVIRLLVTEAFNAYLTGLTVTTTYGISLRFENAVVEARPPCVQSIQIYSAPDTPKYPELYAGDVRLVAGYNVSTEVAATEDGTEVQLAAVPGAGQGVTPSSVHLAEVGRVQRMLSLIPDAAGAVRITGDDCYEIVPIPGLNTLRIEGNCYSCCTCDDYVATATAIKQLIARTNDLRLDLQDIHAEYTDLLTHYHAVHIPAMQTLYAHAYAIAGLSGAGRHGHFTLQIVNESTVEATDITVTLVTDNYLSVHGTINRLAGSTLLTNPYTCSTLAPGDYITMVVRVASATIPPEAMVWTVTATQFGSAIERTGTTAFTRPDN
jgi:hypothetical protein